MDIIDIINNIQTEMKTQQDLFLNNIIEERLPVFGLESLYPNGIPKGYPTMFVGDTETGKSLLSLNLVNNNPDLAFVYIDTHMQIANSRDNMVLFRNNHIDNILNFIESFDSNLVDIVILDDLSYIHHSDENNLRIAEMAEFISRLFRICILKGISLILLNTINGAGQAYFNSNALRYGCSSIVNLNPTRVNNNRIIISGTVEKSRNVPRGSLFEYQAERM